MLPEELRVAVTLRDIHGLEYRDIAQTIGAPIGTVESRIFAAASGCDCRWRRCAHGERKGAPPEQL